MVCKLKQWVGMLALMHLMAQDPGAALGGSLSLLQQANAAAPLQAPAWDPLPKAPEPMPGPRPGQVPEQTGQTAQQERLGQAITLAKAREGGLPRFAADLFETRQVGPSPTDGGIAEDYVLGVGDQLRLNVYGSATFEAPLQVDGRGGVAIPKVGTVAVGGLSLGRAKALVQSQVGRIFSRSTVDLSVTRLREVRVIVLGEVYQPGSFLVPNLSGVINVLSLSGGPTALGSYRDIRILRGGKVIHRVDLYPLRAEGVGNLNFGFQGGDTVFVPLARNQVRLEGAFVRVAATVTGKRRSRDPVPETEEQKTIRRNIRAIEERLGLPLPFEDEHTGGDERWEEGRLRFGANRQAAVLDTLKAQQNAAPGGARYLSEAAQLAALGMAQATPGGGILGVSRGTAELLLPAERTELEYSLEVLKEELKKSREARGWQDQRVDPDPLDPEYADQPEWFVRWQKDGRTPVMLFEMMPLETVQDAVGFAGGFALQGYPGSVSLRRLAPDGSRSVMDVPAGAAMAGTAVERGDVITALPLRGYPKKSVTVRGWARVQGVFTREDGQRVGDLLRNYDMLLPDTYLERGERVRVRADGSREFTAFSLARALAGDPADDLLLDDRDEINLFRIQDQRPRRYLKVVGPVARPGQYEFIEGMRAADLLFRAGVPMDKADRCVAELARSREGGTSGTVRLDLGRLLSTDASSPVALRDDRVNPKLRPDDQISLFARPDYRPHRTVILTGQFNRPGVYGLEAPGTSLRDLVVRAGGLTPEAMPNAGIFLRAMRPLDPDRRRASILAGMETSDSGARAVNEVLDRLNETKRNATTGLLLPNPLLHGLQSGNLNRLVVDMGGILAGDPAAEVELQDGDEIIIPRRTDVVCVVGETASPFAAFKAARGMRVKDLVSLAGGYTRNADTRNVRLLKADGRIVDRRLARREVEPGDALLVPQRIRRDVNWTEELAALTPLAILINTFK